MMWQKVIRAGNSRAITIPAAFAKAVGVKAGDKVKSETRLAKGQMIYTFFGVRQKGLWDR